MSRYYDIKIFAADANVATAAPIKEWTSYPNLSPNPVGASGQLTAQKGFNQNDPGALNVILDIYQTNSANQVQAGYVQIWGVALADLLSANNFTNCQIQISAGFQAGLPLNQPSQAGLIYSGVIFQAYGNWQGTDMTLDFVVLPGPPPNPNKPNIVINWLAGTALETPLKTALQIAFPSTQITVSISPNLVLAYDVVGYYQSIVTFGQAIKDITTPIIGGAYDGVQIVLLPSGSILVIDNTYQPAVKQIQFADLIGQPTWIGLLQMQFSCPMRADISLGDIVAMPQGLLGGSSGYGAPGAVTTSPASLPQTRQTSAFKGNFQITGDQNTPPVHHMGTFRQPDGQSWVTVFNAVAVPAS